MPYNTPCFHQKCPAEQSHGGVAMGMVPNVPDDRQPPILAPVFKYQGNAALCFWRVVPLVFLLGIQVSMACMCPLLKTTLRYLLK